MIGLVIAAHGRLAQELVSTAEGIVGTLHHVATLSVDAKSSQESIREQVQNAVASVDAGEGVLVLADLFGGTPCKECLMLCHQRPIEVLTGVNLPLLLKANSLRQSDIPLSDLAHTLATYGQKSITCATDLVRDVAASTSSGR